MDLKLASPRRYGWFWLLLGIFFTGLLRVGAANYWVATAAAGTGDGSTTANAAYYLNSSFWSMVQSSLSSGSVNVNFQNGNYSVGTLTLTDMGNPLYPLVLQSVNTNGAVLDPNTSDILALTGSQNMSFSGFQFSGPCSSWGIVCEPDLRRPCRNIEFSGCRFQSLTNAYYGAIGLLNGTRDIIVSNCVFTNITEGGTAHMIYCSHSVVGLSVLQCSFTDCEADYVRFRDDSDYCIVDHCTFLSTESATCYPFVTVPCFNSTNPGVEFFGTHYQVTSNSFSYNVSSGTRAGMQISDTGFDPQGYHCALTSAQASVLSTGTTTARQASLQTNMGITATEIKMYGNIFNSRVSYQLAYTYTINYGATGNGWSGTCDISSVPATNGTVQPAPKLRNANFDATGSLAYPQSSYPACWAQMWFANPKNTILLWHPGFSGTTNAMRFNGTLSQFIYQWITSPTPNWTMDCQFAIGTNFTGTGVKFAVDIFHNEIASNKITVGVDNLGRFGIYNGSTFTVLPGLGTVAFSKDANGNGLFNDPGDTLNVYRLRIVGNYSAASPYVDIYTSDANSTVLNHQSLGNVDWVGSAPLSGQDAPGTIAFYNYTAPLVLDQVSFTAGIPPLITSAFLKQGNLIFNGTNGSAGIAYNLLSSPNPAAPGTNWTLVSSNIFPGNSFSITNAVAPGSPPKFYRLQLQ